MKLLNLVLICNEGYTLDFPESSLLRLVNPRTGQPLVRMPSPIGDTLALFIVRELSETYDPDANDDQQVAEAIRVLSQARTNLDNILVALEGWQVAGMAETASNALGYDVDEDRVREALNEHADTPVKALKKALREKEKMFRDQGGRGVDLAEEIDKLCIAIAIRSAH